MGCISDKLLEWTKKHYPDVVKELEQNIKEVKTRVAKSEYRLDGTKLDPRNIKISIDGAEMTAYEAIQKGKNIYDVIAKVLEQEVAKTLLEKEPKYLYMEKGNDISNKYAGALMQQIALIRKINSTKESSSLEQETETINIDKTIDKNKDYVTIINTKLDMNKINC